MASELIFRQLFDSTSSTYTYLLADAGTREALLIDSVLEHVERDLQLLSELGLKLKYVLETHVHADHITGAGRIREKTGARTAVSAGAEVNCADMTLQDGDEIRFGRHTLLAMATPGHTDSCMTFLVGDKAFTGDTLLIRGNGRTDFQNGSAEKLYRSVMDRLYKLPGDTRVYPAHDYNGRTSTTVGEEKRFNSRIPEGQSLETFVEIMKNLKLANPKMMDVAVPANMECGKKRAG